jgi:hypothetical protein
VSCATSAPLGEYEAALESGWTSHRRRGGTDPYKYVWKTKPRWAGTCREFTLGLIDGTEHSALFDFRRSHGPHVNAHRH